MITEKKVYIYKEYEYDNYDDAIEASKRDEAVKKYLIVNMILIRSEFGKLQMKGPLITVHLVVQGFLYMYMDHIQMQLIMHLHSKNLWVMVLDTSMRLNSST